LRLQRATIGEGTTSEDQHERTGSLSNGYMEHNGQTTVPTDFDVLLGPGEVQTRTEGTRRFDVFVHKFFQAYEACDGLQQLSLAREVLVEWRSSLAAPSRFLAQSDGGWVELTEDKLILVRIGDRLMHLTKAAKKAAAEAFASAGAHKEDPPKKRVCTSASHWDASPSLLPKFAMIRSFVEEDVPVNAHERHLYLDAWDFGLVDCDPDELSCHERVTLLHLGRKHGLGLSERESKIVDLTSDPSWIAAEHTLTPTCHDVLLDHPKICNSVGRKHFFDLLGAFAVEIESFSSAEEALLLVGKVLRAWGALDPPGRFLECFAREGNTEAHGWVIASRRTSVLATLQCFKVMQHFSWGKVAIANKGSAERLKDLRTPLSAGPTEAPSAECISLEYQVALEGEVSANGVEKNGGSLDSQVIDVVFGPGSVQNRNEDTRRFHDFVDTFLPQYEACRGLQQRRSLAREVLDKWRSSAGRPCRFSLRSGVGCKMLTEDKHILGTILSRWFVLRTKMDTAEAGALAHMDNVTKTGTAGDQARSESSSIIVRLGMIRTAVKQDAPLSPQEQSFYNDATAAGLTRCDPAELGVSERLTLFGLGRQCGFELGDQESSILDRMSD
jgi:hypothetical protein